MPPSVQNLRFTPGQPLSFEAVVDVAPQVQVGDWKGYSLTRRVRPVNEAAVDAMLAQLREESAVFADVRRPAGPGDIVLLDTQRLDANGRRLAGTRAKGTRIQLGAPELLPDLEAGLTGAEAGQERTLAVRYPDDYRQKDLAGQQVRYVVQVRAIQEKKPRDLDDNFARELFGLESLALLRERVRRNLEGEDAQRGRRELEAQAIDELVRRHPMDLSPRLVSYMLEQVVHEQVGRTIDLGTPPATLEAHYRPGVERSLRREIRCVAPREAARARRHAGGSGEQDPATRRLGSEERAAGAAALRIGRTAQVAGGVDPRTEGAGPGDRGFSDERRTGRRRGTGRGRVRDGVNRPRCHHHAFRAEDDR